MLTNDKVKSVFQIILGNDDFTGDIKSFKLKSKPLPPERTTFSKYSSGKSVEWTLEVDAVFDGGSATSLHAFLWQYAGYQAQFILKPFQDIDPATKRYYQGAVRIPHRPDIKIKAGATSNFTYEFTVVGHPVRGDQPGGFLTAGYYSSY